jgi:hypothetical protein
LIPSFCSSFDDGLRGQWTKAFFDDHIRVAAEVFMNIPALPRLLWRLWLRQKWCLVSKAKK